MDQVKIKIGLDQIACVDSDIKNALLKYGYPQPRCQPAGFATLVNTIVSQQLSARAADTIMRKLISSLEEVTPECVAGKRISTLRKAGLSQRKATYIKELARAINKGEFQPEKLNSLDDSEAIKILTKLHGFGEWSAEIYLMFSLQREDIFPANDLALQTALARLKKLDQRPTPKIARELISHWSPWRSIGSLFLWHYYQSE